jgi:hypothetical protein
LPAVPQGRFDLDCFISMPRLLNLHVSPDGSRLAMTVQTVAGGTRFAGAIWELDISREGPARTLAQPEEGATARGYLLDGSVTRTTGS